MTFLNMCGIIIKNYMKVIDIYMNLTMLGTSHGVPSAERYTSSYMIEVGGNIYIFAVVHCSESKFDEIQKLNDKYSFEVLVAEDDDEIEL